MSINAIDKLKKMHAAQAIEQKDFSLQELMNKPDEDGTKTIEVIGLASKYVPKYHNENNQGYHTMIYLKDGKKTGAFSNALYEFACFFYSNAGLDLSATFNKVDFTDGGYLKVKVSKVELDKKRSTYNFEIVDGEISGLERTGAISGGSVLAITDGN